MKIILTGSIAVDRIMNFNGLFKDLIKPDKLHVLSVSILLNQLVDTRGGIAANIAYGLAQLGDKPILYGSVGQASKHYMEDLAALGTDISHVHYSDLPTASFTVMTDSADCQIGGFFPGAMGDAKKLDFHEFSSINKPGTDGKNSEMFVVISSHDPSQMSQQVSICNLANWRLFYDVGQQVSNIPGNDIKAGIEAAELLIVNDYEMAVLVEKTGWTQTKIVSMVKVCVITLGEKGCEIYQGSDSKVVVPGLKKLKVVDPTGAGDAFRAGFLYGYTRDWSATESAQLGSTMAAYAIEYPGTQTYQITQSQVFDRCRQTYDTFKRSSTN